ncbi:MAG: Gfo/Idh/MocA family oxidoreductase [Actinomycetota bacterium]
MSDRVNVLLAGAGRAGLVHGRNLAHATPGATLVGIADPDREARERAVAELGCDLTFENPVDAVGDEGVDAVVVATPTFSHASIVTAALEADKHVLCEKPLTATPEDARAIARAVEESAGSFSMAFMRRFDPRFVRAAERISSGEIGEPVLVRSTGRGPGMPPEWAWNPEASGGLIAEVNSHDLDTVRWLSGQDFASVHAFGRAAKRPDIAESHPGFVDVVIASFELDRGGLAQVDGACPADYGYDARVEVYGTEGVLLVGSPVASSTVLVRRDGVITDPVASWRELFADAYRAEDAHFVAVAKGDAVPRTGIHDGLRALEAVLAVKTALATGQRVSIDEVKLK